MILLSESFNTVPNKTVCRLDRAGYYRYLDYYWTIGLL